MVGVWDIEGRGRRKEGRANVELIDHRHRLHPGRLRFLQALGRGQRCGGLVHRQGQGGNGGWEW